MAPADLRKEGSSYDLPLAIGILASSEQISDSKLSDYIIMGELSLDGSIRKIKGAFLLAGYNRKDVSELPLTHVLAVLINEAFRSVNSGSQML